MIEKSNVELKESRKLLVPRTEDVFPEKIMPNEPMKEGRKGTALKSGQIFKICKQQDFVRCLIRVAEKDGGQIAENL